MMLANKKSCNLIIIKIVALVIELHTELSE